MQARMQQGPAGSSSRGQPWPAPTSNAKQQHSLSQAKHANEPSPPPLSPSCDDTCVCVRVWPTRSQFRWINSASVW